jgi:hypothetical protein
MVCGHGVPVWHVLYDLLPKPFYIFRNLEPQASLLDRRVVFVLLRGG